MGITSFKNLVSKNFSDIWNIKTIIVLVIFVLGLMVYLNINGITSDYKYRINLIDRTAYLIKYTGHDEEITVPHKIGPFTVTDADRNTYTNCDFIEKVFVPAQAEYLIYFDHLSGLKEIEYDKGTREVHIDVSASVNLKKIVFPEGVEGIYGFFGGCTLLENVGVPSSVKEMQTIFFKTAFYEKHKNDKYYVVGEGVLLFYNGPDDEVIIPYGVKQIDDSALVFEGEKKRRFYCPDSLEYNLNDVEKNETFFYGTSQFKNSDNYYYKDIYGQGEIVGPKDCELKELCNDTDVTFREITPEEDVIRREKTEAAAAEITYQD